VQNSGKNFLTHYTLAKLSEAVSKIRSAQKLRNEFMPRSLFYDKKEKTLKMAVGSARGKLRAGVRIVALTDVKRAAVEINEPHESILQGGAYA
jgi:hypothetical protein